MTEAEKEQYIPFGEEWEKSMMRMSKAAIVKMYRKVCIEKLEQAFLSASRADGNRTVRIYRFKRQNNHKTNEIGEKKMSEKGQEYIPFGEEWKESLMRMSKAAIVKMYRKVCIEKNCNSKKR